MTGSAGLRIVLASGSTGRLSVLRGAGIEPEVVVSGVDETCDEVLDTGQLVAVLAERKASAVATLRPGALVLGCDSMLDFEGQALGKPATPAEAVGLWQRLSGRQGTLHTGHCLIDGRADRQVQAVASTVVRFGTPTPPELTAYVATGEPLMVAGGFCIDGLGSPFIDGIDGDPSNVIGLSMPTLRRMLAQLGIGITDLWQPTTAA